GRRRQRQGRRALGRASARRGDPANARRGVDQYAVFVLVRLFVFRPSGEHMEIVSVTVEKRSDACKAPPRRARAARKVLGTCYGPKQAQAIGLQVDEKEFAKKIAVLEGSALIQFQSAAPELASRMVLLREVQSHPVSGAVLHADFYEVDLTKKLEVTVALHFTGKAVGVEAGGILQPIVREVTVMCLPTEIPAFIDVAFSALEI